MCCSRAAKATWSKIAVETLDGFAGTVIIPPACKRIFSPGLKAESTPFFFGC